MFDKPFDIEIITPERTVVHMKAVSISAPGVFGGFQILWNHAPLLSALEPGKVVVRDEKGGEMVFATGGGFLEVRDNRVLAMLDSAERPEEIDVERAREARNRAAGRLRTYDAHMDASRADAALHRAMNRLRVAGVS